MSTPRTRPTITWTADPELLAQVQAIAAAERKPLSRIIDRLIQQALPEQVIG